MSRDFKIIELALRVPPAGGRGLASHAGPYLIELAVDEHQVHVLDRRRRQSRLRGHGRRRGRALGPCRVAPRDASEEHAPHDVHDVVHEQGRPRARAGCATELGLQNLWVPKFTKCSKYI